MLWWSPLDVSTSGSGGLVGFRSSREQDWTYLQWWPSDVSSGVGVGYPRGSVGYPRAIPWCMWCAYPLFSWANRNRWKHYLSRNFVCRKICKVSISKVSGIKSNRGLPTDISNIVVGDNSTDTREKKVISIYISRPEFIWKIRTLTREEGEALSGCL